MRLVINKYSLVIVFILVACTISNIVNGIELGVHVNHQDLLLKLNSTNTLTPINLNLHVITGSKQAITNFKADILLLHGAKFTSSTWETLETIKYLASSDYRVFAIDLPGFGKSEFKDLKYDEPKPEYILYEIIKFLHLKNLVIVSPSMSGRYSLPFLIEHADIIKGYIPVAPTIPPKYDITMVEGSFSILVVWGGNDTMGKERSKIFLDFKGKKTQLEIPQAGHACYLDDSFLFHSSILDFLKSIYDFDYQNVYNKNNSNTNTN